MKAAILAGFIIIIGHRGASGHRPEHTIESYSLAIAMGADFIEPDLVSTKDGVLVARHENEIGGTTDVADKFPTRKATKTIDGQSITGWFTEDFTLAEIKTLRAKERLPFRSHERDGMYPVPTFEEVLTLAETKSREVGRTIGVYPETKHPTYFRSIGLPLEPPLLEMLKKHGKTDRTAPVFIQSFEQGNLQALSRMTRVRLIQLIDANDVRPDGSLDYTAPFDRPYDWTVSGDPTLQARTFAYLVSDAGLKEVARYAAGIGPWKRYIVSTVARPGGTGAGEAARALAAPTDLVQRAHAAGLLVHPYAFRNEAQRLAGDYAGNPVAEYLQFFELGVDGVFSDFTDTAVAARVLHRLKTDADCASCLVRGEKRDCD